MRFIQTSLMLSLLSLTGCHLVFPDEIDINKDTITVVDDRDPLNNYAVQNKNMTKINHFPPTVMVNFTSSVSIRDYFQHHDGTVIEVERVLCDIDKVITAEYVFNDFSNMYDDPDPTYRFVVGYYIYDEYGDLNKTNQDLNLNKDSFKYNVFLIRHRNEEERDGVNFAKKNNESFCFRIKGRGFFNAGFETNVIKIPGSEIDAAIDTYNAKRADKE